VAPGAPLWTQADTDLALALTELEADRCPGCQHPRSESMDPAHEFDWVADPVRCHACAARDRAARVGGDGWDDAGINWTTTRKG
jgi:hypothetical protein